MLTTEAAFGEATAAISFESGALRPLRAASAAERFDSCRRLVSNSLMESDCLSSADGERSGPFDAIVLSTGTAARDARRAAAVGDCVAPRGLWSATSDAARLVESWQD